MTHPSHFDPNNPPPPLMSGEPGSFARRTMTTRKPAVIQTVLDDHPNYPATITQAVQALFDELVEDQPVQPLQTTAPDGPAWQAAWQPHRVTPVTRGVRYALVLWTIGKRPLR